MISGEIKGAMSILKALKSVSEAYDATISDELKRAVIEVEANAKRNIQKRSPGEKRVRYRPKRSVTAASPGTPPNTDTGRLVSSIRSEFDRANREGIVGTNLKYGKHLEFGTRETLPRPWLHPAFKAYVKKLLARKLKVKRPKGVA